MIYIQQHIEKLNLLRQYMDLWIDWDIGVAAIEYTETKSITYPEPRKVYNDNGKHLYTSFGCSVTTPHPYRISFEEWLNLKCYDGERINTNADEFPQYITPHL